MTDSRVITVLLQQGNGHCVKNSCLTVIINFLKLFIVFVLQTFFFSVLQIYKELQLKKTKMKNSKIQVQNKTQTLRKSYTFLNKVCTRRGHINI